LLGVTELTSNIQVTLVVYAIYLQVLIPTIYRHKRVLLGILLLSHLPLGALSCLIPDVIRRNIFSCIYFGPCTFCVPCCPCCKDVEWRTIS